ncbi:MAG TPA: right-handed parallel beta-helix repeat-containing protein, partial [Acidimicrobiales bacterium]
HGTLQMRPANPAVQHVLTFADVDEEAFTGGHTEEPMAEDVGLWVLHDGVADLAGAPKTPWTRLTGGADKGATTITVQEAEGWQVGDEIVIAPTEPATVDEFWLHNDRTTITAISGTTVTLAEPLAHPHPVVTVREGVTHTAEVLNLTRNVRLQGTPEGRAHVMFLHCNQPQDLSYLAIRHMGPRQGGAGDGDEDNPSAGVEGRYGLHFHMCGDGTRGSKVTGVTVADTGNHAFVPHLSHGMTFERCVSHDTRDDAFWWDPAGEYDDPDTVPTHNVVYDRCVASTVLLPEEGQGPAAFFMGVGKDNVARGCVAFGSTGHGESAAAFHWPERSRSEHDAWIFEDCLAHNCQQSGIYYWQNEVPRTNVDRFTAYQNRWGIWAGAYANDVSYRECTIYRNLEGGLEVQAASADEGPVYEDLYVDQGGLSDFACVFHGPIAGGDAITTVSGCTFKGGKKAQVTIQNGPGPDSDNGDLTGQNYEFVDCTFEGNAFWLEEGVRENAHIKVSDSRHGTLMLHKKGSGGTPKPEWNATATPA